MVVYFVRARVHASQYKHVYMFTLIYTPFIPYYTLYTKYPIPLRLYRGGSQGLHARAGVSGCSDQWRGVIGWRQSDHQDEVCAYSM